MKVPELVLRYLHAYLQLHLLGELSLFSVEVWQQGQLVDGMYGMA